MFVVTLHSQSGNDTNRKVTTEGTAKIAQLVEHDLAKVGVAGSSPVFRSRVRVAELVDALL